MLIKDIPDVSNEFTPHANTLHDFFTSEARGFYIPLYQRPYSWNKENIEQLMEDILKGVENTLSSSSSVSFLGTVILCLEQNKRQNIEPVDLNALPGAVYNVIDGQQRISTLSLLATRLYRKAFFFKLSLDQDDFYDEIIDIIDGLLEDLESFFRLRLKTRRAEPKEKPLIIRGSHDEWTLNGEDTKYTSTVAHYLATFIRELDKGGVEIPDRRTTLGKNLKEIDTYIDIVMNAHIQSETHVTYPHAKNILGSIDQELIWTLDRPDFATIVIDRPYDDPQCNNISTAVQLCMFFHYLFHRTCLSVIVPTSEDWAFDIFQSLNATGTPLTAIETFKPLVVNTVNRYPNSKFKGSKSEQHFNNIDMLFEKNDTAEKKIKLTKEFLNVFRITVEGKSLSNHFSHQRKWLNDSYNSFASNQEKDEFVHRLANLAKYWENVKWFDSISKVHFYGLKDLPPPQNELTVLCVKYLDESGHRMADTLLSKFYALVLRDLPGSPQGFSETAMALAAFFTIWRSAFSNTGLDEVYRRLFDSNENENKLNFSWNSSSDDASSTTLKAYLVSELEKKGISNKKEWLAKASRNLRYDNAKTVCKFALLVTSHDTIPDELFPGLVKKGAKGVAPYMDVNHFTSSDLKTIEHVAPQNDTEQLWDRKIYSEQGEHLVGNLTLLPVNINSSVGNKAWGEKVVYYKHLALTDPDKITHLRAKSIQDGIDLSDEAISKLTEAKYAHHIKPIVGLDEIEKKWDIDLIEQRSERICSILWDSIRAWL